MEITVATHSGPFHADDVLAWALIRVFRHPDAKLVRTREMNLIEQADIVIDVGGEFDPRRQRFDHHQTAYQGPLSSAGMVLNWLTDLGDISPALSQHLKAVVVDYVDDVDNGRRMPEKDVPCFASMVEAYAQDHHTLEEFTAGFQTAGAMAVEFLRGIVRGHEAQQTALTVVRSAMETALEKKTRIIRLERYYKWKPVYFASGGATHPTQFILMPGVEGTWRIVAIPPEENSFAQKQSLPESWSGLTGEALSQVTGVPGAVFCHKNRFIAVFETEEIAIETMKRHDLYDL